MTYPGNRPPWPGQPQQPQPYIPQPYQPQPYQPPQPPKQKHTGRTVLIVIGSVIGAFIVLGIIGAALSSQAKPASNASSSSSPAASSPATQPASQPATQPASTAPAAPHYTAAQQQAIDSAEGYLTDGQGFSRYGLIHQLDSHYGEDFSKRLAVFAVDHVKVNWFHQAFISARGYMHDGQGFSYNSLVQQLHSTFGEGFTLAQAEYAAKKVGL